MKAWCASAGPPTPTTAPANRPARKSEVHLTAAELEAVLERFRGEFVQTPPPVSAKKVEGAAPTNWRARTSRWNWSRCQVHVYELTLLELDGAIARLRAHCSGGTYMRSIAHDLGQALGCGAHLQELRRLASGGVRNRPGAHPGATGSAGRRRSADGRHACPAAKMLPGFPSVFVDDLTAAQIRNGRNFPASPFRSGPPSQYVKAVTRAGRSGGDRRSGAAEFVPSGGGVVGDRSLTLRSRL